MNTAPSPVMAKPQVAATGPDFEDNFLQGIQACPVDLEERQKCESCQ